MALGIRQDESDTIRVLTLSGRLDTETAADLELAMQDLLGAGERDFLIDLGGIGYVSSAGLRVRCAAAAPPCAPAPRSLRPSAQRRARPRDSGKSRTAG